MDVSGVERSAKGKHVVGLGKMRNSKPYYLGKIQIKALYYLGKI